MIGALQSVCGAEEYKESEQCPALSFLLLLSDFYGDIKRYIGAVCLYSTDTTA